MTLPTETITALTAGFRTELTNIMTYWSAHTVDHSNGGFYGRLGEDDQPDINAVKGSVLNARILWSFSAAYRLTGEPSYLELAQRSLHYNRTCFADPEFGGVYWSVSATGAPQDTKKQVYAIAFMIYGLTEYCLAVNGSGPADPSIPEPAASPATPASPVIPASPCYADGSGIPPAQALEWAIALFREIEQYSFDPRRGGYFEAFTRDWKNIDDLRLSEKDANEKKTMNTHLHILEAYTNLYRVWSDEGLAGRIRDLIKVFLEHIIDPGTDRLDPRTYRLEPGSHHLILFFSESWEIRSDIISYGHDIEASWLLTEAAEVLVAHRSGSPFAGSSDSAGSSDEMPAGSSAAGIQDSLLRQSENHVLRQRVREYAIKIALASAAGLNPDGSLNYEFERAAGHLIGERHWWVQAEAMVGFLNAWQLTGEPHFWDKFVSVWNYTRTSIVDQQHGEWFWGRNADGSVMAGQDKAGFWKCPYHNSRACIELIHRLHNITTLAAE